MAVLVNRETGQAFEIPDDEAPRAAADMDLVPATPDQIEWLRKQREYEAKPVAERALESAQSYGEGLSQIGGKAALALGGLAGLQPIQGREEALYRAPDVLERQERHPIAHALGVQTPALTLSGAVGGFAGMAAESAAVGLSDELVASTQEERDFSTGAAVEGAAVDLAFSALAHAATGVAGRVGNLLLFGTGNTMARNIKRGLDESAGPVVPDDVRFEGPLLEAETRSARAAAAASPGMPPGPERDEMLRRAARDLNQQVETEGGDLFERTAATARESASVGDSDAVSRRIDDFLTETTPAQTSWSADATRKLDQMRQALGAVGDEPAEAGIAARARETADEAIAAIDGAADSAEWFKASGKARDRLDAIADEIADSDLPEGGVVARAVEDTRSYLEKSLADRALFGAAAEMDAGLRGAARDQIGAAVRASGGDLRAQLAAFVSADAAERVVMRAPLEQAIDGFEELARAHERFGTARPRDIERLRENAASLRRALTLADDVGAATRSAPAPAAPKASPDSRAEPNFSRAETLAGQIRQRAAAHAKRAGVQAAQKVVDYAAGPGRAVYDDAVSDALKGAIQTVGALGGLAAMGPPGFVAGWLGARSIGKKMAPKVGQQILDAARRYVKTHGADTAGAALLAAAALGDGDDESGDADALAASVGGLFFARRFAERAIGSVGKGAQAAGKGLYRASEAVTGAVDSVTGKATEALGRGTYKAGRTVGEAAGAAADTVAKVAADEDLVKSAIKSGVRDPKRWLVRNTRGRIADKAAEYFGPRISGAAARWLEKRHGKAAQEVVNDAIGETAAAGKRDVALLEQHSAQSAAMVEDVGAQIRAALNETPEQKARALEAFPQRIGGDAHAQRQLLTAAVDELADALGKVSDGSTAKVAIDFANAAKEAIINARTARDRFRIGMQLTETLVHHTAEVGDSEMAKVFGAFADKMWEAMGQRELWMGARELERETKRLAKKRESIIAKISAGEKLGIAALVGSAAVDDDETGAAIASAGGLLAGKRLMREAGTIPPKGKAKRPDGPIAAKAERDVTPTEFYPNSNAARNEYGESMRAYREAQRADNLRAGELEGELSDLKKAGLVAGGAGALALGYEDNGAAMAGAGGLGLLAGGKIRRLSGYKRMSEIAKEFGGEVPEHLGTMLKEAKVGSQIAPNGMSRLYDASRIGVAPNGRPVVFDAKGYAQSDARHVYQKEWKASEKPQSKNAPIDVSKFDAEFKKRIELVESVKREGGFGTRDHRGYDTIEVNEKALKSLATKTGKAIQALDPEEQLALLDYIEGGGASTFRGLQQGAEGVANKERFAESLPAFESAVEKLQRPGLTESIGPLWRGFHLSPEDATRLVNSEYVETGALTSTSFSPFHASGKFADTAAAQEMGHVPVVLKFDHVERAAPISAAGFSKQYGTMEREALLPKGSAYQVKNVTRHMSPMGGSIEVTLSEVPKSDAMKVGFVLAGLLGLGAALSPDEASAAEPEPEAPPLDDQMVAAQRIISIDDAATRRIRHTARVLSGLAEPPSPEGLTTALGRFGAEYDDPRSAFEERKAILQKAEIAPALVYDVIAATFGDVARVSPELYQAASARLLDGFRYMRENLPPEIKTSMLYPTGLPPSESAMRDWATQWNTVMDPESVLDDIDRGTVTHLQIETLEGAHPDTYQQLRTEIIAEVGANFADIPTSTKQQLDILFQADGLAGPMFSSAAAVMIGEASRAASKRKQPGPADTGATDIEAARSANGIEAIRSSVTNRAT